MEAFLQSFNLIGIGTGEEDIPVNQGAVCFLSEVSHLIKPNLHAITRVLSNCLPVFSSNALFQQYQARNTILGPNDTR